MKKILLSKAYFRPSGRKYAKQRRTQSDRLLVALAIRIHEKNHISYWDALIIASAYSAKCQTVYTEDLNHGQVIHDVKIINPFL